MMPITGALLVTAILILPATIAMRLTNRFSGVILLGVAVALFCLYGGLYLSYQIATPPSATITLLFGVLFIVVVSGKAVLQRRQHQKHHKQKLSKNRNA